MSLREDIAGAEAYISRTSRRLVKQRNLIGRSRNREIVATARDLVAVLTALLKNVEHQHQRLRDQADRGVAKRPS
jgi:hypothetical protein